MIFFEWDERKAVINRRKHNVSFEEAQTVFYDEFALQFSDQDSSEEEDRFILLGMSAGFRLLIVVHCERNNGDTIRIISARKVTARERKYYRGPKK